MATPILYMTQLSPPSRAVLITAEAIGLELEIRNVDLTKGEHRKAEYVKLNPLHSVPTLVDGETVITDSHAINAYLVRKYAQNDDLYPKDWAKRALVDQRLHFDSGILFIHFKTIAAPVFYQKSKTVPEDQANKVLEAYKLLETFLEKGQWMADYKVTIADFTLVTTTTALALLVPLDSASFPKTVAWIERFGDLEWARVNESGLSVLRDVIRRCMS